MAHPVAEWARPYTAGPGQIDRPGEQAEVGIDPAQFR
jgi:hypothetical protein